MPMDYSASFAGINNALGSLGKQLRDNREREEFAKIGEGLASGQIDYNAAAGTLARLGRVDGAIDLLKLGEAAKTRNASAAASQELSGALSGLGMGASQPQGLGALGQNTGSALPTSLNTSESGGNWQAQNDAVGSGGLVGHFGRAQFGQARLQEAAAAGAIPPGTTPQQFMNSEALQKSAENWHFGDIDNFIARNGLQRAVGASVAGVPVTIEGMRAVAHLGGKEGLKRFLETGGRYNPSDRNGTSLLDYLAQHGGGRSRVAAADRPAPGAGYATSETGQPGFFIPPGDQAAPMSARNFDLISKGEPVRPVFDYEGASQPWMGTALTPQPSGGGQPVQVAQALPPPRPYDLRSDQYAAGGAPTMVQPSPIDRAGAVDIDPNSPDAGSRTFAAMQGRNAPADQGQGFAIPPAGGPAMPNGSPAGYTTGTGLAAPQAGGPMQIAPRLSSELGRPTNPQEMSDYRATRQMETARGRIGQIASALANPNLPANARAVGEIFLKEALEQTKAPDAVKEFMYARGMGWTTAKSPAEYQREKTKVTPEEETEGRKRAAAAAGLKPGDAGYQGFILTGKMPREDMGPLTATDKKAILEADEGVLAANTAIEALGKAKELSPRALGGWGAGGKAAVANNLPDWLVPDRFASPAQGQATAELENVVTSQALAQLKSIFGAAPTEGERKILLEIQGSVGQPDNVRQQIYDRGIAMAKKRLEFNQQRADELRGGSFYRSQGRQGQGQSRTDGTPGGAQGGQRQPDTSQARQAPDGNYYVPDPNRPGKFLMVKP